MSSMDESTKSKRNRAEKKNNKQQIKESEIKTINDADNDSVFEDSQQQQVYLLLCAIYIYILLDLQHVNFVSFIDFNCLF
jgi:hypothetical protein